MQNFSIKHYKMIDSKTHRLFGDWRNHKALRNTNTSLMDIYRIAYPNANRADVLELIEFSLYNQLLYEWHEVDEVLMSEWLNDYEKEYLHIIQEAFLKQHIEFGSSLDEAIDSLYLRGIISNLARKLGSILGTLSIMNDILRGK